MTRDEMDAAFEAWYVKNAFDYAANPVGSRDCGLQRKSYRAGYLAGLREAAHIAASYDEHIPTAIFIAADRLEAEK